MKINNNKYYQIFFYICIIIVFFCIIFLEKREYYDNKNICNKSTNTPGVDDKLVDLLDDPSIDFDRLYSLTKITSEEECKGSQCEDKKSTIDTQTKEEDINAIYIFYDDNRPLKGVKYFKSDDPNLHKYYPDAYFAYNNMKKKLNDKDEKYKFAVKKDKGGITTVSNNISQFIYIND